MAERDLGVLKIWHKAAARAATIEDFERAVGTCAVDR